jgi:hypothetical protein
LKSFLSHVEAAELDGPNYDTLQSKIKSTIDEMKETMDCQTKLIQKIDKAPYRPEIIDALKDFDYGAFKKGEKHRIKEDIFHRVEDHMKNGKIKEMHKGTLSEYKEILKIAYRIKAKVDASELPGISDLWEIDFLFSQTYTFGKYVAQIFTKID